MDTGKDRDMDKNDILEQHIETGPEATAVSINRNTNARIVNPLAHLSKERLLQGVEEFCNEWNFQDKLTVFQRGALVAQKPIAFEEIEELTEEDKYHLRREITHRWHLPKALYGAIAICSLGSALQGWDNTGANGALLSFPVEFGIADQPWLVGVINASPALFGLLSAWAADPVNNLMGRRGTIFFTGLFVVFPVLAQAFTQNWWGLMLCRLFMGIGMGIKISTIPIFTAEVSPASIRGGMVTSFQLWVAFGIVVGFSCNLAFNEIGRLAWRFELAAAFAPAIPILVFVWMIPESPRWLLKKSRYEAAYKSFCRLRNSEVQAARDLYYAHLQIKEEHQAFAGRRLTTRMKQLFTVPRLRRATVASAVCVCSQQFSGINIMAFYSSTIFAEAGYNIKQTLLCSWGFGMVTFLFAFPAIYTMDSFGRRNMLLTTFPLMAVCLAISGCAFLLDDSNTARLPLIAAFSFLFGAFYGPGIGPIPSIYFSEAFPLSHREIGGAFTICVNNAVGSALSLTFPSLLAKITPTGAFLFYAGLNIFATVLIFFFVPETRMRTLEELDYVFAVPTRRHMSYQLRTWLPWWFKRYVLWQKTAKCEDLYHFDGIGGTKAEALAAH